MRVLYLAHQFFPESQGETERVCLNLARAAQRSGHYVHVLACTLQPDRLANARPATALPRYLRATYHGVPITFVPRSMFPDSSDDGLDPDHEIAAELAGWIASERFGIVHVMHPKRTASALLAVQHAAIPYVITLTDFFSPCFRTNLVNLSGKPCVGAEGGRRCARDCLVLPWTEAALGGRFQQANALLSGAAARVCPSEFVAEQYRTDFSGLTFSVIAHGIDMLALREGAAATAREAGTVQLGYVGPLIPVMGVDLFLRAFARFRTSRCAYESVAQRWAIRLIFTRCGSSTQADTRVELLYPVPSAEVYGIIESLDALCIPSRAPESFSFVLQQANAAGVPAIVSALGTLGQSVSAHKSGLLVAPDDLESWVAALSVCRRLPPC